MITPVILAGGQGRRLWPLSTPERPKPFLALTGAASLLEETLARLAGPALFAAPVIIGAALHRFLIAEQARPFAPARIVLEPAPRGTAAAAAVGALIALDADPDALVLIAPADHAIADAAAFRKAVAKGAAAAMAGRIVLFGVKPDAPAACYGYIQPGEAATPAARVVAHFTEKPSPAEAQRLIATGGLWNSGIFLCAARTLIAELEALAPSVLEAARAALAAAVIDPDFLRLDEAAFAAGPDVSLDVAVMEKTRNAAVVAADFAWSDVGAWTALWQALAKDAAGNVVRGAAVLEDASGSLVFAESTTVAAVGLKDMIVVATPGRVLIAPKHRDQEVRALVERTDEG
jgi:mannose-1-phosphate guanylyltransferase/mannose-6-phosphate isomerase